MDYKTKFDRLNKQYEKKHDLVLGVLFIVFASLFVIALFI